MSDIEYKFVVTNTGTADLQDVVVTDATLAGEITVGDLAVGQSYEIVPTGEGGDQEWAELLAPERCNSKGVKINTVTVNGESAEVPPVPVNDSDSAMVDCEPEPLASLGDTVWFDTDSNGIQDVGESGAPGLLVELLDCEGNMSVLATQTTDANGNYLFDNLTPGVGYCVRFHKPGGYDFTTEDAGTDDAVDSDANVTTGETDIYVLAPGEHNPTVDAGLVVAYNPGL